MNLSFSKDEIKLRSRGLTFDDVLLVPKKSEVRSRRDPDLHSLVTRKIRLKTPILSANMDTVTESEMMIAMHQMGGLGILHRFLSVEDQVRMVHVAKDGGCEVLAASIGVNEEDRARARALVAAGVSILTIDIAHGHSVSMLETLDVIKQHAPNVEIIAGNVATPEATEELIKAGASSIKVGIGPGSMCTTRIITGCGVPQLTAIALCAEVGAQYDVPVIADGGIKTSGDIVKAFAAGASAVMLGSMLSGTLETPGEIKNGRKQYRGMASKAAQVSWRGGVPEGMAPEGESEYIPIKGRVKDVILELTGGIRSGMSYLNAESLPQIQQNARFIEMSGAGFAESKAHGLRS